MPWWKRPAPVLLLLWLLATGLNWGKAFHIDDSFHLFAAQWVSQHPLQPLSGLVNWADDPKPLHHGSMPPGFFYLVASTGKLLGWSEWAMHALVAAFTGLALIEFRRLAGAYAPDAANGLLVLFACCPAFLVNQNVMADIPLLALHLLAFRLVLLPGRSPLTMRVVLAALFLSVAVLIKYATLPLLLVFPLVLILQRRWRALPVALLPLGVLLAWGVWNRMEFGYVHLLDRDPGDPSPRGLYVRVLSLLVCTGAMAPFTPALVRGVWSGSGPWIQRAWWTLLALFMVLAAAVWFRWVPETASDQALRIAFLLNGLLFLGLATVQVWQAGRKKDRGAVPLVLWAGASLLFIALFAPGMASRYLLPAWPPLLLLLARAWTQAPRREKGMALACTAALGLVLSVSDRRYAEHYRRMAPIVAEAVEGPGRTWATGHWGWQWYAEAQGIRSYAMHAPPPVPGDVFVVPENMSRQHINPKLRGVKFREWPGTSAMGDFFNVSGDASMYSSDYEHLPWHLSRDPYGSIRAWRITTHGRSIASAAGP
jgi:hypothetical protein